MPAMLERAVVEEELRPHCPDAVVREGRHQRRKPAEATGMTSELTCAITLPRASRAPALLATAKPALRGITTSTTADHRVM